ncbi:Uncharacterised protein [Klebsiella michiganensis]|nr:Uncharacterised protein [Klebsiella michiganensis]
MRNPARSTFAVEERLPAIHTSAFPALTMAAANISGSLSFSSASGGVFSPARGKPAAGKRFAHLPVAVRVDDLHTVHRQAVAEGELAQGKGAGDQNRLCQPLLLEGSAPL